MYHQNALSTNSELNQAAIKYLTEWRKSHPRTTFDIKKIDEKSTLFKNALKNGNYKQCAKIERKELTEKLKQHYIDIALFREYIDV